MQTAYHDLPAWYDEVSSALAYSDHVVLSGNVGDVYPSPGETPSGFRQLGETLWDILHAAGFGALLVFDPVRGLDVLHAAGPKEMAGLQSSQLPLGSRDVTLSGLIGVHQFVSAFDGFRVALLIDHASHLKRQGGEALEEFFVAVDLSSRQSRLAQDLQHVNPTFWLVDHPADLPDWFVLNNAFLREVQLEVPNLEDRFRFATHLARSHGWLGDGDEAASKRRLQQFALECDGKPLVAMDAIARVAEAEGLDLDHISDAIRVFRTGSRRNPWTSPVLRSRMQDGREMLEARIKAQPHAIDKTLDILARSILGLSGAQSGAMHTRPRGALFFVGPTGVGKTELAKAVTELLFGDETLCHRFDMSEFMEENSVARLIGAPPGQPAHEKGGELVNAAMRRPFSVFLFDEVEKAHPRVLDLFLQILDEGRLTDARGATAYFSEALIVFTSNIGIVTGSKAENLGMTVLPSDSHAELTVKITRAVEEHFRNELRRPELLNRIGQNVVVFDFLTQTGMGTIFDAILARVLQRVEIEQGVNITFSPEARQSLRQLCTRDSFDGGRGIANRIETHFINPLARQFFQEEPKRDICITAVEARGGKTVLVMDAGSDDAAQPRPGPVHPTHPTLPKGASPETRPEVGTGTWRARFQKRGA